MVVTDDAYFGLFYNEDVLQESLFARLAGAHERILAIKVDGPTKESMGLPHRHAHLQCQREDKRRGSLPGAGAKGRGAIRSTLSSVAMPSQSILAKAMADPDFPAECAEKRTILEARARKVQEILEDPDFADLWEPYPFNAGYFMCLRLKGLDAERYRKHLLEKYGVGVIADGKSDIRVAFSSVEIEQLPELYATLAAAARDLKAEDTRNIARDA